MAVVLALAAAACQQALPEEPGTPSGSALPGSSAPVTATNVQSTSTEPSSPDRIELPAGFDLQGHRGARGIKPENTLPAFETALDLMVTTLEFDLHFSADDEIVVWHDPAIVASKCGLLPGAPADVPDPDDASVSEEALAVRSLSAEQLSWYQCDRNPDAGRFPVQDASPTALAGAVFSIVTLDALIDFVERYAVDPSKTDSQRRVAATVRFNMETKRKGANPDTIGDGFDGENPGLFEIRVLEIIEDRAIAERTTIQSFDIGSLRAIRSVNTSLPLAFLESRPAVEFVDLVGWGITKWSPNLDIATPERVAEAHAAGLAVKPWTVASIDQAVRLIDSGVDGLITDRPDLFSQDG